MADFVWPATPHGRISSGFGKRKSPGGVGSTDHRGIDIAGCSYILAARAGTVSLGGYNRSRGYFLRINHGGGVVTLYQHLKQNGYLVKNGQQVTAGQRIGVVGSTGAATGPHLHFEVQINGKPVNPENYSYGTATPTGSLVGIGTGAAVSTEASQQAAAVIHIPQTEKVWTAYEGDKAWDKPVDAYRVTWQSMETGQIRDITDRCSVPELTDDSDSLCLELSFEVMQSTDDYFVQPLALACGDMIAVTNTGSGEVVFLGQIQRASGNYRTGLSVRCLDGGRLLTANEVIMQFNNCPAKTALSQIANKVGIKTILCPDLVSSVYGIYKESAASIIQKVLETVTSENGVPYFVRMAGDTLTVRSFGKDVIDCYFRQADNLSQFNVLDEISDPQGEWSIEDLRNKVIIYSEKDSAVSLMASASDAGSIARYGQRVAVESFSDESGVTAQTRAKTLLAARNRVSETFRAETYGSDRVTAGVRLRVQVHEMTGEFWVKSVTHRLGTPHRMSLTLMRAEVMG